MKEIADAGDEDKYFETAKMHIEEAQKGVFV